MNNMIDYLILRILVKESAISKSTGMTLKEFPLEDLNIKVNTLQKKMKGLEKQELVKRGYRDSRSYTYYITKKALELLESEEDKNE